MMVEFETVYKPVKQSKVGVSSTGATAKRKRLAGGFGRGLGLCPLGKRNGNDTRLFRLLCIWKNWAEQLQEKVCHKKIIRGKNVRTLRSLVYATTCHNPNNIYKSDDEESGMKTIYMINTPVYHAPIHGTPVCSATNYPELA
jgi:hypothetical protein